MLIMTGILARRINSKVGRLRNNINNNEPIHYIKRLATTMDS